MTIQEDKYYGMREASEENASGQRKADNECDVWDQDMKKRSNSCKNEV